MKFSVRIYTVIPGEAAHAYGFSVEADSLDQAQINLSRKLAHDWLEILEDTRHINVRTSFIAATEIEKQDEPA